MIRKTTIVASLALTLGACGSDTASENPDADAKARGEVLGGSISDSMIPLDELKSHSAPMKATPTSTPASAGSPAADASADAVGEGEAAAPDADDTAPELPED